MLGVVDYVVERGGQGMPVARRERCAAMAAGQAVNDVARDAIAFLLAHLEVLSERRVLGVVDKQVAQQ